MPKKHPKPYLIKCRWRVGSRRTRTWSRYPTAARRDQALATQLKKKWMCRCFEFWAEDDT
jgi:hypothetical protein